MDDVGSGKINIYAELGVAPDASSAEITRKYRQLALRYHPDKNPSAEAATKFHFFSQIYSVLSDPSLRRQYDDIRRQRSLVKSQSHSHSHSTQDNIERQIIEFRDQLRSREADAQRQSQNKSEKEKKLPNVEVLAMRGLRLRRELQARLQQKSGYVPYTDLAVKSYTSEFVLAKRSVLEITWKYRSEPEAQINAENLGHIMERFGPVETIEMGDNDGRYAKANVTFNNENDAKRATAYDYKSAQLWHGTPFRKLASLLRSVRACETASFKGQTLRQAEILESVDKIFNSISSRDTDVVMG